MQQRLADAPEILRPLEKQIFKAFLTAGTLAMLHMS